MLITEEKTNKLGPKIEFGPAYSLWSNGTNERNHYSCDIIKNLEKARIYSTLIALNYIMIPVYGGLDINI